MSMDRKIKSVYVIVPVYNVEKYVAKCINSILDQDYVDIKLIIIDDGSTDNSGIICDRYAPYERVTVIHQANRGLSGARNAGIDQAMKSSNGHWGQSLIAFIDGDDYIHPQMISALVDLYENTAGVSIIGADAKTVCEDEFVSFTPIGEITPAFVLNYRQFAQRFLTHVMSVSVCNKLFELKIFDKYRFSEGRLNEDGLLLYEIVLATQASYAHFNENLYFYLMRHGSISRGGFGKSIIDMIGNFQRIENLTSVYVPQLQKEANDNMLYGCATFCNTVPFHYFCDKNNHISKTVLCEVRKRRKTITQSDLSMRDKMVLMIFSIFPLLTVFLISCYRVITR